MSDCSVNYKGGRHPRLRGSMRAPIEPNNPDWDSTKNARGFVGYKPSSLIKIAAALTLLGAAVPASADYAT